MALPLIDDFTDGPARLAVDGLGASTAYQPGAMLGGGRYTHLHVAVDPRHESASLEVGDAALDVSLGAQQLARIEVGWGFKAVNGRGEHAPLDTSAPGAGDFVSHGNMVRANFSSLNTLQPLNFNALLFTPSGYLQAGINVEGSLSPFSVNFHFAGPGVAGRRDARFAGVPGVPQSLSNIRYLVLIFQGNGDFVVTSVELAP